MRRMLILLAVFGVLGAGASATRLYSATEETPACSMEACDRTDCDPSDCFPCPLNR